MRKNRTVPWWSYVNLSLVMILPTVASLYTLQPEPINKKNPREEANHLFQLGGAYRDQGDLKEAALAFHKVLETPTVDDQGWMRQAQAAVQLINVYRQMGRKDEIEKTVPEVERKLNGKIKPSAVFYNQLALHYERTGQPEKAKKYNNQARDLVGKLGQNREAQRIEALIYFCYGKLYRQENNTPQAIKAFRKVIAAPTFDPPFLNRQIDSIFHLIDIYSELGRQGEINKLIQEGIQKVEGNKMAVTFYVRLSHYYQMIQQPEYVAKYDPKIIELAEELTHQQGTDYESRRSKVLSHFFLGQVYERHGHTDRAMQEYKALLEIPVLRNPIAMRYVQATTALINFYEKSGKSAEIERLIPQVIEKLKKRTRALATLHLNVSAYYLRNGRLEETKQQCLQALNLISTVPPGNHSQRIEGLAHFNLAKVYEKTGTRQQMIAALQRVLAAQATGPVLFNCQIDAYLQLIKLYNQTGQKDATDKLIPEGTKKVEEALHKAPKGPMKTEAIKTAIRFYFAVGDHYKEFSQDKEAKYYYERVLELNNQLNGK